MNVKLSYKETGDVHLCLTGPPRLYKTSLAPLLSMGGGGGYAGGATDVSASWMCLHIRKERTRRCVFGTCVSDLCP